VAGGPRGPLETPVARAPSPAPAPIEANLVKALVTFAGSHRRGVRQGRRSLVSLEVAPNPALLTRRTARDVARALVRFAKARA
jgi:hypothetical protein